MVSREVVQPQHKGERHPPSFTACPPLSPTKPVPKASEEGCLCHKMLGSACPVADSGLCLWLYWESLAMPFLPQHALLRLDSTCSLPLWDVGIVTSNNSAGMLRGGIPFGKPRARGEYNAPWTTAMLSSELRFPQCSVKLFQSLPSLQTLMGSQENSTRISWLVQTFLQGPRVNCC